MASTFYLGIVLGEVRKKAGVNKMEIAQAISHHPDHITQMEKGTRSISHFWKVERWLDVCGAAHLVEQCKKLYMVSFSEMRVDFSRVAIDDRLRTLAFRQWVEGSQGLPEEVRQVFDKYIGQEDKISYIRDCRNDRSPVAYKTFSYNPQTDTLDVEVIDLEQIQRKPSGGEVLPSVD